MSRFFVGLALWALLLALAACGGDSKGTDPKDAELAEMVDTVVSTYDDLTVCTDKREGTTAYVEDEDSAYVCKKGLWVVDDSLSKAVRPDSEKKSSSSAKAKSSSNKASDSSSSAKLQSSSSAVKTSSSSKEGKSSSSSSSAVPLGCKTETEDNCEYGTLTDDRDGQTYKTVKIGEQWWMAENLNYRYIQQTYNGGEKDSSSYCYDNDPANCAKYGRLYLWSAAMDSAGIIPGNTAYGCGYGKDCNLGDGKVRGVCPMGWHLPDTTEWNTLFTAVGGKATAGKMLKSTEGWNDYYGTSGNGSDTYSFSALPAGLRSNYGDYNYEGLSTLFWSSTENDSNYAYNMDLYYDVDYADLNSSSKYGGISVRCLKDYGPGSEKMSSNGNSSSSEKNSSSSSVALPCKTETEDNCEYGTLTDDRDGQTYKTVKIGEQWWMAENLNYAYTDVPFKYSSYTSDSTSWCYDNDAANCAKYGRLYTWAAAMDSAGTWSTNGKGCGYGKTCSPTYPVRGVCPEGWHLPSRDEWNTLFTAVGGSSTAGEVLKSTSGWNSSGNGSDACSFSALPAGYRNYYGYYSYEGDYTYFWSSTEDNSGYAYYMYLGYSRDDAYLDDDDKIYGFSVRCVKD
ncbi:MAG: fibrobacter succinogenes major paralogous domain-containing protein [Fibrobacter sp.]|nr:fibrobacter succinogenes major paralogous domain-containing protein [Fibrobacter sp.]